MDYNNLTYVQLKEILKTHKLSIIGTKKILVARLFLHLHDIIVNNMEYTDKFDKIKYNSIKENEKNEQDKQKSFTHNNILFFDIETTGIPQRPKFNTYYPPSQFNYYDNSRIVEFAYLICDQNGNEIKRESFVIKPKDFTIKESDFHTINQQLAEEKGLYINDVLDKLNSDLDICEKIVSHNINFDYNVTLSECLRANKKELVSKLEKKYKACTMEMSKNRKLINVYNDLFNEKWIQTHTSMDDTEKCCKCYFKMYKNIDVKFN